MDNNINQQQSQIHPDNLRAALGFSTQHMEQLLKAQQQPGSPQNASQTPTEPQGEAKTPQTDKTAPKGKEGAVEAKVELNMTDKLEELRKEMKDDMQREMDGIRTMIQQALNEEDAKEPPTKIA